MVRQDSVVLLTLPDQVKEFVHQDRDGAVTTRHISSSVCNNLAKLGNLSLSATNSTCFTTVMCVHPNVITPLCIVST